MKHVIIHLQEHFPHIYPFFIFQCHRFKTALKYISIFWKQNSILNLEISKGRMTCAYNKKDQLVQA